MGSLSLLRTERGFSLMEAMVGAGLLGAAALGFSELAKNSTKSTQALEAKYAKMDVEQSLRSAFLNSSSCACAFSGYTLTAGTVTALNDIKMTDPTCGNPRIIVKDDDNIPNSTVKVENISVRNVTAFSTSELIGDLQVDWKGPLKGLPLKPSVLRNIRFAVTGTGAVTGCGIAPDSSNNTPVPCGDGKICFNGKVATFTNAVGAPITTSIVGSDTTGMMLWFQTPAGRTTMMKFAVNTSTGALDASRLGTWRPQFCYSHQPNITYCGMMSYFGTSQPNCGAPLYWTYDGHSANSSTLTAGTVTSSGPPIQYAVGTWPFKDTSTLPCSY